MSSNISSLHYHTPHPLPACFQRQQQDYPVVALVALQERQARELNEQGCFSIEVGQYDQAIRFLTEALNTIENAPNAVHPQHRDRSKLCGLDLCMSYTQGYNNLINYGGSISHQQNAALRKTPQHHHSEIGQGVQCHLDHEESDTCNKGATSGYIYQDPIRIPYQALAEGRCLGVTLPLIVVFNLALAYHLNAIHNHASREHLETILQLYEMAYYWHTEQERLVQPMSPSANVSNLKFVMIIANNLAQIHLAVQNNKKHQLCLQHLLSTMMFVVDGLQFSSPEMRPTTNAVIPQREWQGFLSNVSSLFLRTQVAAAA